MLHCCQAAGCVKECCKRYKMCKHSDTHMTGNEGCWLVLVPFITSIWIHVYETKHQIFFHVLACVCVFCIVLRSHKCVFFSCISFPCIKKQKKQSKPTSLRVVMLWWVGGVIENVSYHFCRALIFNDSVPCIIYCLRLLLIQDWFGNKQSCHHSRVARNSLKRPLDFPSVQRWHIFELWAINQSSVSVKWHK